MNRCAVVQHVQVARARIDDAAAAAIFDVGVADVPFARDRPVEDLGAGRDFKSLSRDVLSDQVERLAQPVARDAAADRVELRHQRVHATTHRSSRRFRVGRLLHQCLTSVGTSYHGRIIETPGLVIFSHYIWIGIRTIACSLS
jgi:hypothetical protein